MSIRASQVFITRETRRLLSVIARSEGSESTADSVAERLLSEAVETQYPGLAVLQKQISGIEEQMVKAAQGQWQAK